MGTFILRGVAPNARLILWRILCPAGTTIQLAEGEAELDPGEIVTAYEVVCVGEGIRQPLSDIQLMLLETGTSLGLVVVLALLVGWITTRGERTRAQTEFPIPG